MRSNRDKDLETIINEMYSNDEPANITVGEDELQHEAPEAGGSGLEALNTFCLLYTSDAADE